MKILRWVALFTAAQVGLAACTVLAPPAHAQWRTINDPQAIILWSDANDECVGESHLPTDRICRLRDAISVALNRRGWCYEYADWHVSPTEYRWHRCGKKSPG